MFFMFSDVFTLYQDYNIRLELSGTVLAVSNLTVGTTNAVTIVCYNILYLNFFTNVTLGIRSCSPCNYRFTCARKYTR